MQRYHSGSCTSAVNSSAISGIQARETSRADSSAVPPNFSLNSRRSSQLAPYRLRCDKEQLNSRLGPPDFHPQSPNRPEEALTREYVQSGYRETVEGLDEAREISLSQVAAFTKSIIVKSKETIRKCHRAINESRAQKRKAGQVYGVPLSGALLTKSGIFPEQRSYGEDIRKKWIEGLSQPHKRLRLLADHVPHGYRKKSLFEVLIRNNIPLLRATWFIKITYLNQVRPNSSNSSSGLHDKIHLTRSDQWTKDVIEYLQLLLDEFITRNNSHSSVNFRDRSSQMVYAGSAQQISSLMDGEEPSLYTKWWYMVRIIHWHHTEGLLDPSLIIDWVLNQLQEKELLGVLQLLLPIIYGVIETVVLSQIYVRTLVGIAVHFIREPSPGGSDLVENSRQAYTLSAVVEMLRYLILAVPDSFVALDCFPLPTSVISHMVNYGSYLSRITKDAGKLRDGKIEVARVHKDTNPEVRVESFSFYSIVSSIKKRAETLSRTARPNHPGHNAAKDLQILDQALLHGDIGVSYKLVFENLWDGPVAERWLAEVSPCLHMSLKYIGAVNSSLLCSVFFICEWATCEFRDFRTVPPCGLKFSGRKDFSQIFLAIRLLKLKASNMHKYHCCDQTRKDFLGSFESPGPLHDVIVCWIDQHEVHNGEGFKRLQLLLRECMVSGIFSPQVYVRQLIVSGIMDGNGPMADLERRKRHYKILKQLPAPYVQEVLKEADIVESPEILEAMNVYSNERRLVLYRLSGYNKTTAGLNSSGKKRKDRRGSRVGNVSSSSIDQCFQGSSYISTTKVDNDTKLEELKASISALLQFPTSFLKEAGVDDSRGSSQKPVAANSKSDPTEEIAGCEECRRVKRQKLNEEQSWYIQSNSADEEELWWVRKGLKFTDTYKAEPPPKPVKLASRGRQKSGRKTQSLSQLAAARIEGSQGASTSHVSESRIGCPYHRTGFDDVAKSVAGTRKTHSVDVVSIGKLLKQMRFLEKRTMAVWLISSVKQLIEEAEKSTTKIGQHGRTFQAAEDRCSTRWRLGEDELSAILYIMDVCNELVSTTRFLFWLLQKVPGNASSTATTHGRNIPMLTRAMEYHACEVGEAFLLSSIRRYENIIVAADLIPETLSATMDRSASVLASNGRLSGSPTLAYARYLLRKYSNVGSVLEWEKTFKSSCDKRLGSELESGRSLEGDFSFPLGVPNGVEDLDDYFRQKITGVRLSRVGLSMKEIAQRIINESSHYFYNKDRKSFGPGTNKNPSLEKWDDGHKIAQQLVMGLMDCMRQTGGAAQEGDPSLVSSAIAAIVNNVGQSIARIPDLGANNNHLNAPSSSSPLHVARRLLRVHITCLCILKEALGDRQSRVFEVALATEASSVLVQAFAPGKAPRSHIQLSPEAHDFDANLTNENANHFSKGILGRTAKTTAAVSALIIGAILQGVASLERMVSLFKLKEGLDLIQFARSLKSNANGNARSTGVSKVENLTEVSVNWFRVLVGNCRTVSDGFVVELLGEASIVALSRMQRTLPVNLVFPPAFSIFSFVIWRPILDVSIGVREDLHQLYQSMSVTMSDAIKHLPFRDICLRDTCGLYNLISADTLVSEFVSVLESIGSDISLKFAALVPLRPRLFLDALIDCKMPQPVIKLDDGSWISGQGELKKLCADNVKKLMSKLIHVLDTLQPARFHWQWVELRLLLNEQAINEKMENDIPLMEAIRSFSSGSDKHAASENESNFVQIILTRLLVRPDAAPLFSEVVHLLGKSLEDSMLSQAKWLLRGWEVLYGKKSIRQKVINIAAELKEPCMKPQFWRPWGWCPSDSNPVIKRAEKWKSEAGALEEGEVVDDGSDFNQFGKGPGILDVEGFIVSQQHVTETALIELVLPCLDQGSDDLRSNFASEMIKQMSNIEQQINAVTRGIGKQASVPIPAIGSPANKSSTRKSAKSGSPGISRQSTGSADTVPPSPAALRASLTLRLQFLLRLLPLICSDREPSGRNMRYALAPVILRLLGSRVVHEDAGHFVNPSLVSSKRDVDSFMEISSTAAVLLSGDSLFDCLLLVLHVLLSSHQPSWLRLKSESKFIECSKEYAVFDREAAQSMQNDLDRMELPQAIRWRIQTAMPILHPSVECSISCQPPSVPSDTVAFLQPSHPVTMINRSNPNPPQRNTVLPSRSAPNVKSNLQSLHQDLEMEIDRWILLEDGAGSSQPSAGSAVISGTDHTNLKASNWLRGAVRMRRTDLTYIGTIDEDS
ncbi:mediator of RNA polymerase II transcription subunit 12-like [Primulina eburnea]|uniref:mediator of RNA polymerase II transcription subunit 12-like n=1 Tax=Primulina eburnea TaxID=1245227 RepID=UPI003C6C6698